MGHLRINPTSGHFLVHPVSKHLIKGCPRIAECANCSGTTPRQVTVVISGVSLCLLCQEGDNDRKLTVNPNVGPNGTFVLDKLGGSAGGNCRWEYHEVLTAGTMTAYNSIDETCVGVVVAAALAEIEVVVIAGVGGTWTLISGYTVTIGAEIAFPSFNGNTGAGEACENASFTNDWTICPTGVPNSQIVGYGGTATVTV